MRQLSSLCLAVLILALLAGCGQKGPLYLPGDEEAAETYDPGNEYADEQADDSGDDSGNGNNDNGAEATPTTSDGEG